MLSLTYATLLNFSRQVLIQLGVPDGEAEIVADTLVTADLRGVSTHGCEMLPEYVRRIKSGAIRPVFEGVFTRNRPWQASLDAAGGFGQVAAFRAMEKAIELARANGIGAVGVRNSNHFGAAAYYAMQALTYDLIGIAITNTRALLPAWGGRRPVTGNNPFAVAIPSGGRWPIVLDMALSQVAKGKIRQAAWEGRPLPEGWAFDKEGRPTTDPVAALGGMLMPVGQYKGFGLALILDVLAGVLTGAGFGTKITEAIRATGTEERVGHLLLALDPGVFLPGGEFKARVGELVGRVKSSAPDNGGVYLPGEKEYLEHRRRLREGIPLPEETVRLLRQLGEGLGVPLEF